MFGCSYVTDKNSQELVIFSWWVGAQGILEFLISYEAYDNYKAWKTKDFLVQLEDKLGAYL